VIQPSTPAPIAQGQTIENVIPVPPRLIAEMAGIVGARLSVKAALFVSQLRYWSRRATHRHVDGRLAVWKTYDEWSSELRLPVRTLQRLVARLRACGVIETAKLAAHRSYHVLFYFLAPNWRNQTAVAARSQQSLRPKTSVAVVPADRRPLAPAATKAEEEPVAQYSPADAREFAERVRLLRTPFTDAYGKIRSLDDRAVRRHSMRCSLERIYNVVTELVRRPRGKRASNPAALAHSLLCDGDKPVTNHWLIRLEREATLRAKEACREAAEDQREQARVATARQSDQDAMLATLTDEAWDRHVGALMALPEATVTSVQKIDMLKGNPKTHFLARFFVAKMLRGEL
jgi:hypothetical protein